EPLDLLSISLFFSPGSIAAIVSLFIVLVLVVLGGLYYYKIRRTNYGRLLDSQDYGMTGNFNNPMYDPYDA
uniref:Prostate androgen-regulated mucin-like protein 1 n=3 Tax=Haplochromini TaxID=319058 RepID=A0A3Q2WRH5_HAPBU